MRYQVECATEGCGKLAAIHYVHGEIGSWYCQDCYAIIHKMTHPALAEPRTTIISDAPEVDHEHPDDAAVDRFASAMKGKLARKRIEGRGGWNGPECDADILSRMLREHVEKGDPLDVGNLAMMLHQRGERISAPAVDPVVMTAQDAARVPDDFQALLSEAMSEASRAMVKFPQPNYVISKFAEESGEVVKAAIHHAEGRETRGAVVGEMRQVLAMMLRMWLEGDQVHGLPALRAIGGGT
jgi:phosphoribosyl-ATP pyrophosphohydrolase